MTAPLVLPIVVPLGVTIACVLTGSRPALTRVVSVGGAALLFACAVILMVRVLDHGIQAAQIGDWPAPFGITLVADPFAAIMVLVAGFMGLAVAVYGLVDIDADRERFGFHALYHALLAGICGAFLAGDLFNLYVWFEVMMIASFALLVLGSDREQLDGGVKYVAINLVSTIVFLTACGLTYGVAGTLNMAELHAALPDVENQGVVAAIGVLLLVAFGIKAAVFPLFFWLPAAYHAPPVTVTAIFAALLTKVGVYALIRIDTLVFAAVADVLEPVLLVTAVATMIVGVLGAVAQNEVRRILSFHIVSQIGYILLGLAMSTALGLAGAVFYLVHNIVAKTNLFLVSGAIRRLEASLELKSLGGLYVTAPLLSVVFLVSALSLAGMPPLSGFWAKLLLLQASLAIEGYVLATAILAVGLVTLYSMTKIWLQAFWKPAPDASAHPAKPSLTVRERAGLFGPMLALTAIIIAMGVAAQPFLDLAMVAATHLRDPAAYVTTVLGRP